MISSYFTRNYFDVLNGIKMKEIDFLMIEMILIVPINFGIRIPHLSCALMHEKS